MGSLLYGFSIARTGSVVSACARSVAIARAGSVAVARAGFFLIAATGSFVITALRSFVIAGVGCFVIAGPIFFFVSCSKLARFNVDGANTCACAAALEMARSDIIANGK